MVSKEFVVGLYKRLLGREPENATVVDNYSAYPSELDVVNSFVASDEYRATRLSPHLRLGRHLLVETLPAETQSDAASLKRMLRGVAKHWTHFGKQEPHWSVLTNESFLSANIGSNEEQFYKSGNDTAALALAALSRSNVDISALRSAIDFGCGVGRITVALASHFQHIIGVDISSPHLLIAKNYADKHGIHNTQWQLIDSIDAIQSLPKVDFVNSLIVLQHNPPPVMATVLHRLLDRLNPGGAAYIQVPTYIAGYRFSTREYFQTDQPAMEMNYLPQHEIFQVAYAEECIPLEIREDAWTGDESMLSHSFLFRKMHK